MRFSKLKDLFTRTSRGHVASAETIEMLPAAMHVGIVVTEGDAPPANSLPPTYERIDRSAFFDRDWYLAKYEDVARHGVDPVEHYIQHGWREGRRPGPLFDSRWYLEQYKDVGESSIEPLDHYLEHGLDEGRMPNPFFDAGWYEGAIKRSPDEAALTPYAIYTRRGLAVGDAPLPELQAVFWVRGKNPDNALDQYTRLVYAIEPWWEQFGRGKFAVLAALFSPYEDALAQGDAVERLISFLEQAWTHDVDPGPLFRGEYYARQLREHGMKIRAGETLLQHYLREGFDQRVVPTPYFDERAYCRQNPDLQSVPIHAFEHFVRWGVFEGRRVEASPRPVLAQFALSTDASEVRMNNWKYFLASCGNMLTLGSLHENVAHYAHIIDEIFRSDVFKETMRRAVSIDAAIGDPTDISDVLVPPFHDARNIGRAQLRARLPQTHYDTVVCVPWIRTGGADLVACQLSAAIKQARPGESLLILRTDQPNFDRPEWVPPGIDVVDASDVFKGLSPIDAQVLLYGMFMGLTPSRVINVNSRLCWDTLARFGSRLAQSISLYSYLFCWDQTASGYRVGYPSEFFPETAQHLRAVFTDTNYLKNELTAIYRPPAEVRRRIVPLYSPANQAIPGRTMAEAGIDSAMSRHRPKVLWAGRLDRQKRFDLVQGIATAMPEVDFVCWGSALLDAPPDHQKSPANLVLNSGFSSYDELPLADADLWLFTSEWEGMPTILIELAHRGMSIVASSVGGVSELIDECTGWLVTEFRRTDAYVLAIRSALASPTERVARALALRERARGRHSMESYVSQIADVLDKEGKA